MLNLLLNPKIFVSLAIVACILFGAKFSYNAGYGKAQVKYEAMLTEFSLNAEKLRTIETVVRTEIVTEYKDRVRVIKETEQQIIYVTDGMLQEEQQQCVIGPNFIELHNRAASQ